MTTSRRRTEPTHPSYIERSAQYYAASGYERRYAWATNTTAPFTPLAKPLAECTVGVVTTAYLDSDEQPFVADRGRVADLRTSRLSWAKDETNTDDPNSFVPLDALDTAVADGVIAAVSPRIYGVPTVYSHRATETRHAPQITEWLRSDGVDIVLAVPL